MFLCHFYFIFYLKFILFYFPYVHSIAFSTKFLYKHNFDASDVFFHLFGNCQSFTAIWMIIYYLGVHHSLSLFQIICIVISRITLLRFLKKYFTIPIQLLLFLLHGLPLVLYEHPLYLTHNLGCCFCWKTISQFYQALLIHNWNLISTQSNLNRLFVKKLCMFFGLLEGFRFRIK